MLCMEVKGDACYLIALHTAYIFKSDLLQQLLCSKCGALTLMCTCVAAVLELYFALYMPFMFTPCIAL